MLPNMKKLLWPLMLHMPGLAWCLRPEETVESSLTSVICVAVGEGLRLAARHCLGIDVPSCCS